MSPPPQRPPAVGRPSCIPTSGAAELALWLLRRRHRMRVRGPSMEPTLRPGQVVLVDARAYRERAPAVGEVVVARHPEQALDLVKRVAAVRADGALELRGDNAAGSSDSRHFGAVRPEALRGRVTSVMPD